MVKFWVESAGSGPESGKGRVGFFYRGRKVWGRGLHGEEGFIELHSVVVVINTPLPHYLCFDFTTCTI
jgi:hypothetical protein